MLHEGAQRLIAEALEAEFDEYLAQFAERRDDMGRFAVVRNDWQPRREVLTGLGPIGCACRRRGRASRSRRYFARRWCRRIFLRKLVQG